MVGVVLRLSVKFCDDEHIVSDGHWAQIMGIPKTQLQELEALMWRLLQYKLYIPTETHDLYLKELRKSVVLSTSSKPVDVKRPMEEASPEALTKRRPEAATSSSTEPVMKKRSVVQTKHATT